MQVFVSAGLQLLMVVLHTYHPIDAFVVRKDIFCESSSLPGSLEASYQIPHAHVFFVKAPAHVGVADKVRSSSFVQHVGKGKRPSAPVAFEGGASFRVPVSFTAEED